MSRRAALVATFKGLVRRYGHVPAACGAFACVYLALCAAHLHPALVGRVLEVAGPVAFATAGALVLVLQHRRERRP